MSYYITSWYRQPNLLVKTSSYLETSLSKKGIRIKVKKQIPASKISTGQRVSINHAQRCVSRREKNLIDIMNDHGLEQLVHFPTREMNTLD